MNINNDFEEIMNYAQFWNWLPDWNILQKIYTTFPDAYSILTPFAYSYLEELIRTTTSDYSQTFTDKDGNYLGKRVGLKLIDLAIKENDDKEYTSLLTEYKKYFKRSELTDTGNNRNSVDHGYMHPRFWSKEAFENLIHNIARISKFSKF